MSKSRKRTKSRSASDIAWPGLTVLFSPDNEEFVVPPGTIARLPSILSEMGWTIDYLVDPSLLDQDRGLFLGRRDGQFVVRIAIKHPIANHVRPLRDNPDRLPLLGVLVIWRGLDEEEPAGRKDELLDQVAEPLFGIGAWQTGPDRRSRPNV